MRFGRFSASDVLTTTITLVAAAMVALASYHWVHERDQTDSPTISNWKSIASIGNRLGRDSIVADVVEFADFECPYCSASDTLLRRLRRADSTLAIAFVHFPLSSIHPQAYRAAVAAACAGSQGEFEAYHDYLYSHQSSLATLSWLNVAEIAKVPDLISFKRCIDTEEPRDRIDLGIAEGHKIGVKGTPTFIVAGNLLPGGIDNVSLEKAIVSRRREQ